MNDPIERLARHVIDTRWQDLPDAAIAAAKTFILDALGVGVSGTAAPPADRVREVVRRWGSGDEATVIGGATRLPAPAAAMVNAVQTHNQEFDCIHERAVVHPLATILPAALAVAERRGGVSGRDLILAVALGVDVATTIGMASRAPLSFFRPATAGIFGVAAAVAKLEKLDHGALLDAFGLALTQAAGTMQAHVEGKPTLALTMGFAARGGIIAVDLAAAGFPGPHQVLEGRYGYFPLMEGDWQIDPAFGELGRVWRITELSHKPFPTGRATHGGIDGIQRLVRRHGLEAGAVERVTLLAPPMIHQLVGRPYRPGMQASYARLCFPYVGAVALARGGVGVGDFTTQRFSDPAIADLASRIDVVVDENPDRNAMVPQRLRVLLKSGTRLEELIEHTLGSPQNPLGRERHLEKFRHCWTSGATRRDPAAGERLIALVDCLDELAEVSEIARSLAA